MENNKETVKRAEELRARYVHHLNNIDKNDMQGWEKVRKEIHEEIFKEIGKDRNSKEGKEFSRKFDASIERELMSYTEIFAKRISNSKTEKEMKRHLATAEFINKWNTKDEDSPKT